MRSRTNCKGRWWRRFSALFAPSSLTNPFSVKVAINYFASIANSNLEREKNRWVTLIKLPMRQCLSEISDKKWIITWCRLVEVAEEHSPSSKLTRPQVQTTIHAALTARLKVTSCKKLIKYWEIVSIFASSLTDAWQLAAKARSSGKLWVSFRLTLSTTAPNLAATSAT